jgi:hypothetical protein
VKLETKYSYLFGGHFSDMNLLAAAEDSVYDPIEELEAIERAERLAGFTAVQNRSG